MSYALKPTHVRTSQTRIVLILLSNIDEELRDGSTLTSRSHGFKLESTRISNPYTSKQLFLDPGQVSRSYMIDGSAVINVLTITSLIWANV